MVRETRNEDDLERNHSHCSLHVCNRTVRHNRFRMGGGTVTSYRDYLALKGLKPIVIERTAKKKGDKVITSSYRKAELVK